jgi:hypothetical protein
VGKIYRLKAGLLLTTECLLADSKEDKEPKMPMGGGGMGDGKVLTSFTLL